MKNHTKPHAMRGHLRVLLLATLVALAGLTVIAAPSTFRHSRESGNPSPAAGGPAHVLRQAQDERVGVSARGEPVEPYERAREGRPNSARQLPFLYVPANSLSDTQ